MKNGDVRRGSQDYEALDRLLMEVDRSLAGGDLRGASETLKKASVKAATMWGAVGIPRLPPHTRSLISLSEKLQKELGHSRENHPDGLLTDLRELRRRFETEAREETR